MTTKKTEDTRQQVSPDDLEALYQRVYGRPGTNDEDNDTDCDVEKIIQNLDSSTRA